MAVPRAHGLQRLTNLGPAFGGPILSAFVSPEDLVWQEAGNTYSMAFNLQDYETVNLGTNQITNPSSIVPDLSISYVLNANNIKVPTYQPTVDFRYTWLFTGQQTDTAGGTIFDGNVVVMENRPFAVDQTLPTLFKSPASRLSRPCTDTAPMSSRRSPTRSAMARPRTGSSCCAGRRHYPIPR